MTRANVMADGVSDWVFNYFSTRSHDLTPESLRRAAQVLYVPVAHDPNVTRLCAAVLQGAELQRAERFAAHGDRALFIQRRAFRCFCGALAPGSSQSLSQVNFDQSENGRPWLTDLPDVWFGFSSCRLGFLGAWSSTHGIGVDIEDPTRDLEAIELARQFFSAAEARTVEGRFGSANFRAFFQLWCLKEAALKSIGEGLPYGLDAFEFDLEADLRVVQAPLFSGGRERFQAHSIEGTVGCAALVM